MTTTQELPALRYDGLYEYAQAHRLDYNELCAVARAALAAQVEPQPVAWVRFCSDGTHEGPIMDATIEDVRKRSGAWTRERTGTWLT